MDKKALRQQLIEERLNLPDRLERAEALQKVMRIWLFGREDLAADQGRAGADLGTGAMTLAQNFASAAEVDAAFAAALAAGATALKRPEKVFWGGYSGYWADPDGHVWEVAHNPFWPLEADGGLELPDGG